MYQFVNRKLNYILSSSTIDKNAKLCDIPEAKSNEAVSEVDTQSYVEIKKKQTQGLAAKLIFSARCPPGPNHWCMAGVQAGHRRIREMA